MALRIRGKNKFYHAYFQKIVVDSDGKLRYVRTTIDLHTNDYLTAKALEQELMARNAAARSRLRLEAHLQRLEDTANGIQRPKVLNHPIHATRARKRLKLSDGLEAAAKYREISRDSAKIWKRFVEKCGCRYFDEVTPDRAFEFLNSYYGGDGQGKSFNNVKSAVNTIFTLLRIDAGIDESPFAKIPNRKHISAHQRPFTEEEFKAIYKAAFEPWKTASLIAWFTGLREKDVFELRWSNIDGDIITTKPAKTARFGRSVQIPLHPQLQAALNDLPRTNDLVLGCFKFSRKSQKFHRDFGEILKSLNIQDTEAGIVNFNCFRDSFVTRCDEAGIPRHATRGIVGHTKDKQTDLYSHDIISARKIQTMPGVKLDEADS